MYQGIDKALDIIRRMPRVALNNLRDVPAVAALKRKREKLRRGVRAGAHRGYASKSASHGNLLPPYGYEGRQNALIYTTPKHPYNEGWETRKQYLPFSLLKLQRAIDVGFIDPSEPLDLAYLCAKLDIRIDPDQCQYGVQLTSEGEDIFCSKINIEVQYASPSAIAAIEQAGGVITTRFYDAVSLYALTEAEKFFQRGRPIPRCKLPSRDVMDYYFDARNRGYLADEHQVDKKRYELAQQFGYVLPAKSKDSPFLIKKSAGQIFYGLEAGWIVDWAAGSVLKPTGEHHRDYYQS